MAHNDDTKRSEPSFGQDADSANEVDFDELYADIDRSVADVFAKPITATPAQEEGWVDELTTPPEIGEEEGSLLHEPEPLPAQPAFDFGAAESGDEPVAPQPYSDFDSTTRPDSGEEPMSRGMLMAGGALAALGILLGAVGVFVSLGAADRIDSLQQQVETLQTKISTLQVSGDPRVGQLQAEQAGMTSRLDEINARLDALATPADDKQLGDLTKRLDALEHQVSKSTATRSTTMAHTTTRTVSKPATTKTASASHGDWTVILLSSQLRTQADSERARIQKLGYATDVIRTEVDGKPWYRVRVTGYQSHEAAKAAIPTIERKTGIKGIWAAHR